MVDNRHQLPISEDQVVELIANGQEWRLTWHRPDWRPDGSPHGSAGICVTPDGGVVLISNDGARWDLPAGRPENAESWEETLCREVHEEACATVFSARLLGFSRGHCIRGHEEGLVLVRAMWRAEVELEPWVPRFETRYRRVVSASNMLANVTVESGYLPTFRRAMIEADLG